MAKRTLRKKPPAKGKKSASVRVAKKSRRRAEPPRGAGGNDAARSVRKPSLKGLNVKQAAAVICGHLDRAGHEPVLTGQACAAIYCGNSIKPKSLDFVITGYAVDAIERVMASLGFARSDEHCYENKSCPFEVLLSPPPLTVGDHPVEKIGAVKTAEGPLKLLTPTDCVRQRLSVYYRWGDREALGEALKVARRQKIDLDLVRRWSEWEWSSDRFEEFVRELGARGRVPA